MNLHDIPRESVIPQHMLEAMYGLWKSLQLYKFKVDLAEGTFYVQENHNWTYLSTGYAYWSDVGRRYLHDEPVQRLPEWRIIFDHSIPQNNHSVTLTEDALTG